jgi:hypothetical protein
MPISPEQKRLAEELRRLASREQSKEVATLLLRRAEWIEAGEIEEDKKSGLDL